MSRSTRRPVWARLCALVFVVLIVLPASAPFPALTGDGLAGRVRPTLTGTSHTLRIAVASDHQHAVPSARSAHARVRLRTRSATGTSRAAAAGCIALAGTPRLPVHRPRRFLDRQLIVLRI